MQVIRTRFGHDIARQGELSLVEVPVGVSDVGDQADDLHALVRVLGGQSAELGHLGDARAAESGPDVHHRELVVGKNALVNAVAVEVGRGKVAEYAGGLGGIRGRCGIRARLRGRLAAGGEKQAECGDEYQKFIHDFLLFVRDGTLYMLASPYVKAAIVNVVCIN